jgi:hypothetical protein
LVIEFFSAGQRPAIAIAPRLIPITRPHLRSGALSRDLAGSQRDQLTALERIPPYRRAFFAAHIAFQFVHRCGFGSADNVQGDK